MNWPSQRLAASGGAPLTRSLMAVLPPREGPPQPYAVGPTMIRQAEALDVNDTLAVAAALPQLKITARIAWGVDDKFQKIAYGERFADDLNAPLHRINGGLHFTPEDHPDEIAEQISLLVKTVSENDLGAETVYLGNLPACHQTGYEYRRALHANKRRLVR